MGAGKSISLFIRESISYKPHFRQEWVVRHGSKEKGSNTFIYSQGSA